MVNLKEEFEMKKFEQKKAVKATQRSYRAGWSLLLCLFLSAFLTVFHPGDIIGAEETGGGKNIIFVLDTSGSMKDKFAGVKRAFTTLIDNETKEGDTIAVIAFDTTSRLVDSRKISGAEDKETLKGAVNDLSPVGQYTYIAGALQMAREEIARLTATAPESDSRIIVLTDGKNEVPPSIATEDVIDLREEAGKISEESGWAIFYVVLVKKKPATASSGEEGEGQGEAQGDTPAGSETGAAGEGKTVFETASEEFPSGKVLVVESAEGDIASGLTATFTEPVVEEEAVAQPPAGIGGRAREFVAQYPIAFPVGIAIVVIVIAGLVFLGVRVIPGAVGAAGASGGGRSGSPGTPMEVSFEVTRGVKKGEVYHCAMRPGDKITVGSDKDCKVFLKEEKVAEQAFKVEKTNGDYTLDPLGEVKVEVNNSLVVGSSALKNGDKIQLTGCHLLFKVTDT